MPGKSTRVGRPVKQWTDRDGYLRATLQAKGRGDAMPVHRLIAEGFFGPMPDGWTVDHLNGDKQDNRPSNLEYVTRATNIKRAHRDGRYLASRSKKLNEDQVREIRRLLPSMTNIAIAARYGVSDAMVSKIRRGKAWRNPSLSPPTGGRLPRCSPDLTTHLTASGMRLASDSRRSKS